MVPEVVFGQDASRLCERYAVNFGSERPLIVTDPGVIATGLVDSVASRLRAAGLSPEIFPGVSPNPRIAQVEEGRDLYDRRDCDVIVAIGGGSPMDCAKAIGILAVNGGDVTRFEGVDNVTVPGPPLICVPTTSGTAADISQFAIISDPSRKLKFAVISKTAVPDVALVDPLATFTMDPYLTACTGIDALVHALEALVSTAGSPMTDLHALEAIRVISLNLARAVREPDNDEAREGMSYGSMQAGMAFSNASLGAVHAMAHSLGGLLDLPHGECNALLLRAVIRENYPFAREKYDRAARAAGIPVPPGTDGGGAALADWVARLLEEAGIRGGLASRGVSPDRIPDLARNACADPCAVTNPRPLDAAVIESLYERSL